MGEKLIGPELALPPLMVLFGGGLLLMQIITSHPQLPKAARDRLTAKANALFDDLTAEIDRLDEAGAL